ncbi:MAG: hypothetical protein JWP87_2982 [Labilithrix sp.]|nr:hypothetical protein [Labilithrix sp.]
MEQHEDRVEYEVDDALRSARAQAAAHARRERVLFAIAASLLALLAARGLLAALAAIAGASSPVVPLASTLGVIACGVLLVAARRARARLDGVVAHVRLLEIVRDAADHSLGALVVLREPSEPGGAGAREPVPTTRSSSWARRAVAMAACVAAVALLGWAAAPASATKLRWRFVGPDDALSALDLRAQVEGSGEWKVEDHSEATGARALVNGAGDPARGPSLLVATKAWTRDLRAVTRCKVAADQPARACGVVFRFVDDRNYHAARLDAARGALVVARVSQGREQILGTQVAPAPPGVWQELALEARGDRIRLSWNGAAPLEVIDVAPALAGGAGLWAPAAGISYFDELAVDPMPATAQAFELLPLLAKGSS